MCHKVGRGLIGQPILNKKLRGDYPTDGYVRHKDVSISYIALIGDLMVKWKRVYLPELRLNKLDLSRRRGSGSYGPKAPQKAVV